MNLEKEDSPRFDANDIFKGNDPRFNANNIFNLQNPPHDRLDNIYDCLAAPRLHSCALHS